ncbi:hypothetical protein KQI42_09320 [Tissierella sp. MSJ-40]|uniref:Uncharacterized protein n=1 Tax=Tissierella simiarum TaxID=2841534 RepID=A0ABS6E5K8_9FIRM|nr:hypothetical protein [Tissierella simiarum]MBU5438208.1 hypothetical protein [Tissierella simiarum]
MAKHIIELFPKYRTCIEGFGGAGHILFRKDSSEKEVYNDKYYMLYKFFETIQMEQNR